MISADLLPQRSIFDNAPVGVMESTLDGTVRYANAEALNIVGAESYAGLSLRKLFANAGELDLQLASRRAGLVGSYKTLLVRITDQEILPVEITAIPVVDKHGEIEGTLAFFRYPIDEEINRIHQEADSADTVLYRVMVEICKVIPCDLVTVTRYSEDTQHSQTLFQLRPRNKHARVKWRKGWQEIPEFLRNEVRLRGTTLHGGIQERLLADSMRQLRDNPVVKDLIDEGVQCAIRHTVQKGNSKRVTLFASVSFYSKDARSLKEEHLERIRDLPIAASVIQAFDFFDRKREMERFRLLQKIANCPSINAVCETILRALWEIFGWHHISIYRVDHAMNRVRFLSSCQAGIVIGEPRYEQNSHDGVFGRIIRTGKFELIRDVSKDPDFIAHKTFSEARSEMCWPVMLENETTVRWIIDVLDSRVNAFAEEEARWLGEVADEVGGYMQRLSTLHFLSECMNGTSDATIVTDSNFVIKRANLAAAKLFGAKDSKLITGPLTSFLVSPEQSAATLASTKEQLGVCALRAIDGLTTVEADVSRRALPDDIGGYIFVLKNMTEIWRTLKLELLEKTAYEIATETRTPLLIAIDEIERARNSNATLTSDALDKVLRYLYRVQHAYTKLTMFNPRVSREPSAEMLLDLSTELRVLQGNLPKEMQAFVQLCIPQVPVLIQADAFQVLFVLETLLVFLIRTSPENQPVNVVCDCAGGNSTVRFEGFSPRMSLGFNGAPDGSGLSADLRVAYPLIRQFVECNRGALDVVLAVAENRVIFTLTFPAAA